MFFNLFLIALSTSFPFYITLKELRIKLLHLKN